MGDRAARHLLHLDPVGHVGHHVDRFVAAGREPVDNGFEHFAAARHQDQGSAALRRILGRGQADAAGGAGDDDDLLVEWLERTCHGMDSGS